MTVIEPVFAVDSRHHGKGSILYAWNTTCTYVATTGQSRVVHIFDKHGTLEEQVVPPSASICTCMEWDPTGEILAIGQQNASHILLFDMSTRKQEQIELHIKEVTFLKWDKAGNTLAVGTAKGSLSLYDVRLKHRISSINKHKRRISCGDWSAENHLAFASEDRQVVICNATGDVIDQVKVKSRPLSLQYGSRMNSNQTKESIVSMNMNGRTLLLYNSADKDNAVELAFQHRYGNIVSFKWFGDGFLIAGFSSGYVVVISTDFHEIGREQYCAKVLPGELLDACYCPQTFTIAACGPDYVKLVNLRTWSELGTYSFGREAGTAEHAVWTDQGTILSVSTSNGYLYVFKLNPLAGDDRHFASDSIVHMLVKPIPWPVVAVLSCLIVFTITACVCRTFDVSYEELGMALLGLSVTW